MNTHFLPFDANAPRRQPRYARCGGMTSEDHYAAVPTCLACQRLLAEDDADMVTCPVCGYTAEDGREWRIMFCPSWPDRCAGCEVHEHRLQCPECDHVWETP